MTDHKLAIDSMTKFKSFSDLIAFPSDYLYGEDLNKVLKQLHQDNKYSKLVFYLEACESGLNLIKQNNIWINFELTWIFIYE